MTYTPLIGSGFFDSVKADVLSGASGWLGVILVVAGAAMLIRVFTR